MDKEKKNLEQHKQNFIEKYVDTSLDRLLDLRNKISNATNVENILIAMEEERKTLRDTLNFGREKSNK